MTDTWQEEAMHDNTGITAHSEQLKKLKALFPDCFDKDGRFMPHKLEKALRAEGADITREGYKLDWLGKSYARLLANLRTQTLLSENKTHNQKKQNAGSENLLIQGDNLDVLKHLTNAYREKVKMIYIDPPYNTGGDGFVYHDNRTFTAEELQKLAGIDEEEAKRILEFTRSKSNSHSAWLTFMYPRLYVARELLREDGVIFISIDDNEQAQLKLLCDEVFGEENFVAEVIWSRKRGKDNSAKFLSRNHEYSLCYSKSIGRASYGRFDMPEKTRKAYKNSDNDPRGDYRLQGIWARGNQGGSDYEFTSRSGIYFKKRLWLVGKETIKNLDQDDRLVFVGDNVYKKLFLSEYKGDVLETIWFDVSNAANAADEIKKLFGKILFDTSKPRPYLERFLKLGTNNTKCGIILDFFAGSGTTADAVMQLNAQDGGNRKYICVQLDEPTDEKSEARKEGYKTIFEITRERILRAAKKIKKEHPNYKGDLGFKEFKTIPANAGQFAHYLDDADTLEDYIPFNGKTLNKTGFEAILTTWAAYDGIPLHAPLLKVDLGGYTAHQAGDGILYFVDRGLEKKHIIEMLRKIDDDPDFTPRKIVVFPYSFNDKTLREFMEAANAKNRKHLELSFIQRHK